MLLYVGDILAAYGVLLFFGVWAIRWKDRWLPVVALLFFLLTALPSDSSPATSADPALHLSPQAAAGGHLITCYRPSGNP